MAQQYDILSHYLLRCVPDWRNDDEDIGGVADKDEESRDVDDGDVDDEENSSFDNLDSIVDNMMSCSDRFQSEFCKSDRYIPFSTTIDILESNLSKDNISIFFKGLHRVMFGDGRINKGRLAGLFYFLKLIATMCAKQGQFHLVKQICDVNDIYIDDSGVRDWIAANGGWQVSLSPSSHSYSHLSKSTNDAPKCPLLKRMGCVGRFISAHSTQLFVLSIGLAGAAAVVVAVIY